MGGVVLLTGGTGFLGSQVVRGIVKTTDHTVVALVRARDAEEAKQRLERAWSDWPEAVQAIGGRVEPLPGDLVLPGLGLTSEAWTEISHRVTHIVHSAAELRFDGALEEMRRITFLPINLKIADQSALVLPRLVQAQAIHIVREALVNTHKHA